MKKNIKKIASIAFVALLATGCNGSEITKEQANERVAGIAKYQKEHAEDLYSKGVYLKSSYEGKSADGKETESLATEVWMTKNFFHVKINGIAKDASGETKQNKELYVGEKDDHFYYVDAVGKKYYDFGSTGTEVMNFVNQTLETAEAVYKAALSTSTIDVVLSEFPEGEAQFEDGFSGVLKSKGEGHLYIELSQKSEEKNIDASAVVIFDNYRFSSIKSSIKNADGTAVTESKASYSVSAKMPGINGMEEMTLPKFDF